MNKYLKIFIKAIIVAIVVILASFLILKPEPAGILGGIIFWVVIIIESIKLHKK